MLKSKKSIHGNAIVRRKSKKNRRGPPPFRTIGLAGEATFPYFTMENDLKVRSPYGGEVAFSVF